MDTATAAPPTPLPRLDWVNGSGQLATALGIDPQLDRIGPIVQRVIESGAGIRAVLDTVQTEVPDCTFNEWTAMAFALGYYNGTVDR